MWAVLVAATRRKPSLRHKAQFWVFDDFQSRLLKHAPLPVDLVLEHGLYYRTGDTAWCDKKGDSFKITIDAGLDEDNRCTLLIHEWAHALSWGEEEEDHGPAWGVAYSRCYRIAAEGWEPE